MSEITGKQTQYKPSAECPWFANDPEGGDTLYFATEAEAIEQAKVFIEDHMDDGWSDYVDQIVVGRITRHTVQVNVQHRPNRDDFENGADYQDACDEYPNMDFDTCCNYEPVPLTEKGES